MIWLDGSELNIQLLAEMNLIQTIVNSLNTVMKLWMIDRSYFCDLQSIHMLCVHLG